MPFKKGQSGNPRGRRVGAKDRIPRGSLRAAVARLAAEKPELLYKALVIGCSGDQAHQYLRIVRDVESDSPEMPNREPTTVILKLRADAHD